MSIQLNCGTGAVRLSAWSVSQCGRTVQLAQHLGESHFCLSCLEAVTHRGANSVLRLRLSYSFAKGIRVAAKVLGRCQRDSIDSVLHFGVTGGGKTGNLLSQRSDE